MPVRFHPDENVSGVIASALRSRGIDVTVPVDVGLIGANDLEHLAYCVAEERVLITHDEDFLVLHSRGVIHRGIAYCPLRKRTIGELVQVLVLPWRTLEPEAMRGHVEF